MANLVKTKSKLKENMNKMFWATVIAIAFALIFLAFSLILAFNIIFKDADISLLVPLVLFVVCLIVFAFFIYFKKQYSILKSGVKGENRTYKILSKLSENYTLLTNPVIYNRGKKTELDFVLICSDAVYIVETKNYKGIIRGRCDDDEWTQIKERGNKTYTKKIKNPIKQSLKQVNMLTQCLSDSGISAQLFPIVYFADPNMAMESDWDQNNMICCIKDENQLVSYIVNTKGNIAIDAETKDRIVELITSKE